MMLLMMVVCSGWLVDVLIVKYVVMIVLNVLGVVSFGMSGCVILGGMVSMIVLFGVRLMCLLLIDIVLIVLLCVLNLNVLSCEFRWICVLLYCSICSVGLMNVLLSLWCVMCGW